MIHDALIKLNNYFKINRPDDYQYLRDPWSDDDIRAFEQTLNVSLNDELRALFKWKGGQSALSDAGFYAEWRYLAKEEIEIEWRASTDLIEADLVDKTWWNPAWIPILADENGHSVCVDLAGGFTGQSGQIILYRYDDAKRNVEYPTLESLIEHLVQAYITHKKTGVPNNLPYPLDYPKSFMAKDR